MPSPPCRPCRSPRRRYHPPRRPCPRHRRFHPLRLHPRPSLIPSFPPPRRLRAISRLSLRPPVRARTPITRPRPTNFYCGWGFALALASPFLALITCGFGGLLAFPALLFCIVGLAQVHRNRAQSGQGLAVSGLFFSILALLILTGFFFWLGVPLIKGHGLTVTEETTNDSD